MRHIFLILFSFVFLTSCEKEIDLDLDDKSGNIVIEGNITDQPGPYFVKITKSVAFTELNQYPEIADAVVTINDDNGQFETLEYVGDGLYKTHSFTGTPGRTYTLNVIAEGIEYIAESTMPEPVSFDDLTQDSVEMAGEVNYTLLPIFTDPAVLGNRYLFAFSVNDNNKIHFQTLSDNINNGMVNQRSLMMPMEDDDEDKVKVGDEIHVEMRCVDQTIYTYYTALIQISGTGGPGGSVTPANPPSNISNDALGYFSAHTTASRSIVIQ